MNNSAKYEVKLQLRKGLKLIKKCLSYNSNPMRGEERFNPCHKLEIFADSLPKQVSDYLYQLFGDMEETQQRTLNRPCQKGATGIWYSLAEMEDMMAGF